MDAKPERRMSQRVVINASVKVKFKRDFFFSVARDISTSGIFLETSKVLARGDKIACSFVLQYKIDAAGEVVRAMKKSPDLYHYGVRFPDLDPKARAQIQEVVKGQRRQ